jgi:2-oxoglutarate ferredoxin oxidoreductase subunit delta
MEKIKLSEDECKGCALCVWACPKKVLSLDESRVNVKGYNPAVITGEGCTACAICALVCPDLVITVGGAE